VLLERRTVSRKTPGDGRLEITKPAATRLRGLGRGLEVDVGGDRTRATVGAMTCTCRGADKPHEHYFLESPGLKQLDPGSEVDLELDVADGVVRVAVRAEPSA
jgi:hypothetical protein